MCLTVKASHGIIVTMGNTKRSVTRRRITGILIGLLALLICAGAVLIRFGTQIGIGADISDVSSDLYEEPVIEEPSVTPDESEINEFSPLESAAQPLGPAEVSESIRPTTPVESDQPVESADSSENVELTGDAEPAQEEVTKSPPQPSEPDVKDIALSNAELLKSLDSVAASYGSVAVGLAAFDGENNFFTYQYGYGDVKARRPIDSETKFRVASLSKLTTAICAMALVDAGRLNLDTDISNYLGYEVKNPNHPSLPITSRMLLQHTSSIYDSNAFLSSRDANSSKPTKQLLDTGTSFRKREPGTQHEYANFGYAVLGVLCETITGKFLDDLAHELIFDPLGIDAAYILENLRETVNIAAIYNDNHALTMSVQAQLAVKSYGELGNDHHLAQGNLTISALDYAKILAMLTNDGVFQGVRILSKESVAAIHLTDVAAGPYMQGLMVRHQRNAFEGNDVYWHTGSNYGTFAQFIYSIETGCGVVVVTTGADPSRESNGMVKVCSSLSKLVWNKSL